MQERYTDPIITNYRYSPGGGRITEPITEKLTIDNGKIFLKEVPDEKLRVDIGGFTEIPKEDIDSMGDKNFYADYSTGYLYFSNDNNGKEITIKYNGIGVTYFPASRIYTKTDDIGKVIKTLDDLDKKLSSVSTSMSKADAIKEALEKENVKYAETLSELKELDLDTAVTQIKDLNESISTKVEEGNKLNTSLYDLNEKAGTLNKELSETKTSVEFSIGEYNKTVESAKQLNQEVTQSAESLSNANEEAKRLAAESTEATTKLKQVSDEASSVNDKVSASKNELEETIQEGTSLSSTLSASNKEAEQLNTNLEKNTKSATSKNEELTASNSKADDFIEKITPLIEQSSELRKELEKIISSGDLDKYVTDPKLQEELIKYVSDEELFDRVIEQSTTKSKGIIGNEIKFDRQKDQEKVSLIYNKLTSNSDKDGEVEYTERSTSLDAATEELPGVMSATDKKKLDSIEENANNYAHPETHSADMIVESETRRFVTDEEKEQWSNKESSLDFIPENVEKKGQPGGYASLDDSGKVPSSELPSYVDDVLEFESKENFPSSDRAESGKIYVSKDTNKTYRWSGSDYVEISQGVTLGTTSSTAFRGDFGNAAYKHSQQKGNAHNLTKEDVTSLGVADKIDLDKKYDANTSLKVDESNSGTILQLLKSLFEKVKGVISSLDSKVEKEEGKGLSTNDFTDELWETIEDSLKTINAEAYGDKMLLHGFTNTNDTTDTQIPIATQDKVGIMSAADKKKLDGIQEGATKYVHPEKHSADMVAETSEKKFVTELQKQELTKFANSASSAGDGNFLMKTTFGYDWGTPPIPSVGVSVRQDLTAEGKGILENNSYAIKYTNGVVEIYIDVEVETDSSQSEILIGKLDYRFTGPQGDTAYGFGNTSFPIRFVAAACFGEDNKVYVFRRHDDKGFCTINAFITYLE